MACCCFKAEKSRAETVIRLQFRRHRRRQGPRGRLLRIRALRGRRAALAESRRTLLAIARARHRRRAGRQQERSPDAAWLARAGAAFVTLIKTASCAAASAACAARALGDDVAQNALGAAFPRPRFPPVSADEWPQCRVEVSLLSRRSRFASPTRPTCWRSCVPARTASSSKPTASAPPSCRRSGKASPTSARSSASCCARPACRPRLARAAGSRATRWFKWKE